MCEHIACIGNVIYAVCCIGTLLVIYYVHENITSDDVVAAVEREAVARTNLSHYL